MSDVLIVSQPDDAHAFAVREALLRKGVTVDLMVTADLPGRLRATLEPDGDRMRPILRGPGLSRDQSPGVVWFRRPGSPVIPDIVEPPDHAFVHQECMHFVSALWELLAPRAFWVNPPPAADRARLKPVQHLAAQAAGLRVPETVYSNDPDAVRAFLRAHGGAAVYKALGTGGYWHGAEGRSIQYTSRVTEADLPDDALLQATPGVFQELLDKDHELRVTVIGRRVFAARILSQQTVHGRLDWRISPHELVLEPASLDDEVAAACLRLMDALGLVFGALDFVVTPDGTHQFLEVNEAGQFLFVEQRTGQPLLDAFCELLRQGRADYEWDEARAIRLAELEPDLVADAITAASKQHVTRPPPIIPE